MFVDGDISGNFSEINKLIAIIDSRQDSSSENERIFSTVKRIVTAKRAQLTASNVEMLVRINHESSRRWESKIEKILDLKSAVHERDLAAKKRKKSVAPQSPIMIDNVLADDDALVDIDDRKDAAAD